MPFKLYSSLLGVISEINTLVLGNLLLALFATSIKDFAIEFESCVALSRLLTPV